MSPCKIAATVTTVYVFLVALILNIAQSLPHDGFHFLDHPIIAIFLKPAAVIGCLLFVVVVYLMSFCGYYIDV